MYTIKNLKSGKTHSASTVAALLEKIESEQVAPLMSGYNRYGDSGKVKFWARKGDYEAVSVPSWLEPYFPSAQEREEIAQMEAEQEIENQAWDRADAQIEALVKEYAGKMNVEARFVRAGIHNQDRVQFSSDGNKQLFDELVSKIDEVYKSL